ncbi:MAG: hypothetical protein HY738_09610 [Bacteroidia bacterium]|nr:hypothetical protein [Bacteroidia bacterium]
MNFNASLPGKIPVRVYANIASYNDAWKYAELNDIAYETGIEITFHPGIFSIFFPVLMSSDIKRNSDFISENYWHKIRFTLNISKFEPFSKIKDFII